MLYETPAAKLANSSSRRLSLGALEYRSASQEETMTGITTQEATAEDVAMEDAGPATAPAHSTASTFFNDGD